MKIPTKMFFKLREWEYPSLGPKSTDEWMDLPPTEVYLHNLHTAQKVVTTSGLVSALKGIQSEWCRDTMPHVFLIDGKYYISDGHHRIIVAMLKGQRKMLMRQWSNGVTAAAQVSKTCL